MQTIEVTGKTLAEATELAASKLGKTEKEIKVTVLEESKGLFGKTTVRVQAEVLEAKAKTSGKAVAEEKAPVAEVEKAPKKTTKKKVAESVEAPVEEPAVPAGKIEEVEGDGEAVATEDDAAALVGLMDSLMEKGGLDVKIIVKEIQGKYVTVSLDGKDVSYLIGKQGEVLNALQSLVNIMIGRKLDRGFRATIDSGDFRANREKILEKLARSLAEEVVKRQEEAVLDALPAFERRVVHRVLQTLPDVKTYSEGEEPNRHVVIAPRENFGDSSAED